MSGVALATMASVLVFGVLIHLANRFNTSEIRRTRRKHLRKMFESELRDLRVDGDVYQGTCDGVPIQIEGGWTPGTRADDAAIVFRASVIGGRLAPFTIDSITPESLAREGLEAEVLARHHTNLAGGSLTSDGTDIVVRTTKTWVVRWAIEVVCAIARTPDRVLSRVAGAARVTRWGESLELGTEARPVTITIDRGVRLAIDATPLEGMVVGSLSSAITSLGRHARGPELAALATDLTGSVAVERHTEGDRLAITLPLTTSADHVLRAVELVDRLTETEGGPFR